MGYIIGLLLAAGIVFLVVKNLRDKKSTGSGGSRPRDSRFTNKH